jgi:hypothetical protein
LVNFNYFHENPDFSKYFTHEKIHVFAPSIKDIPPSAIDQSTTESLGTLHRVTGCFFSSGFTSMRPTWCRIYDTLCIRQTFTCWFISREDTGYMCSVLAILWRWWRLFSIGPQIWLEQWCCFFSCPLFSSAAILADACGAIS